uniref:Uncharacterized protein n=1 Tax=Populus trichocarpa TaxID=3694 RepID=U5G161_POPTR
MQQSCLYLVLISVRFPMITHIQECSLHTCLHNPIWKCSCNSARYFIWLSSLNMFCSMLAYYIPNYSVLVCFFHTFFSSFVLLTFLFASKITCHELIGSRDSHAHELRTNQAEIDAIISCRTS